AAETFPKYYRRHLVPTIYRDVSPKIKYWNKKQQEVTTTIALSQRLTQDVGENSHLKLDWMIQWMKESGLIFEEFARYNNIWVPNYTPDMFGPTNMEQEEEAHESEEEGENKEDDGSKEIDFKEGD
ncbi:hypothetical protein Golax_015073, partial [Gossypium laxum]|nr:hypothetical protein [Gossypium laxum]